MSILKNSARRALFFTFSNLLFSAVISTKRMLMSARRNLKVKYCVDWFFFSSEISL